MKCATIHFAADDHSKEKISYYFYITGKLFNEQKLYLVYSNKATGSQNVDVDLGYLNKILLPDVLSTIQKLSVKALTTGKEKNIKEVVDRKNNSIGKYTPSNSDILKTLPELRIVEHNQLAVVFKYIVEYSGGRVGPEFVATNPVVLGDVLDLLHPNVAQKVTSILSSDSIPENLALDFKDLIPTEPEGYSKIIENSPSHLFVDSTNKLYVVYGSNRFFICDLNDKNSYREVYFKRLESVVQIVRTYLKDVPRTYRGKGNVSIETKQSFVHYGNKKDIVIYVHVFYTVTDPDTGKVIYQGSLTDKQGVRIGGVYYLIKDEFRRKIDEISKALSEHNLEKAIEVGGIDNYQKVDFFLDYDPKKFSLDTSNILFYGGIEIGPLNYFITSSQANFLTSQLLNAQSELGLNLQLAKDITQLSIRMENAYILFYKEDYLPEVAERTPTRQFIPPLDTGVPSLSGDKEVKEKAKQKADEAKLTLTVFYALPSLTKKDHYEMCIYVCHRVGKKKAYGIDVVNGFVDPTTIPRSDEPEVNGPKIHKVLGNLETFLDIDKVGKVYDKKYREQQRELKTHTR